eukprot:scaffold548345_cov20-Prasinocladus_malaysianus.AAC.2
MPPNCRHGGAARPSSVPMNAFVVVAVGRPRPLPLPCDLRRDQRVDGQPLERQVLREPPVPLVLRQHDLVGRVERHAAGSALGQHGRRGRPARQRVHPGRPLRLGGRPIQTRKVSRGVVGTVGGGA